MPSNLVDLVKIKIVNTGSGALTLGASVDGYRGVEALTNGKVYSYSIQQGSNYEYGSGTYLFATHQLTRSPASSSLGGPALDLLPNAEVSFVALSEDLDAVQLTADALAAAVQTADDRAVVEASTALVQASAASLVYGQQVYPNAYATALPQGVTALSSAGVATGTGGSPGTYSGGVSGGPAGFAWSYTIGSDGKIASYVITNPGLSSTSTAPTLSYPSGSITGATVPVATVAALIAVKAAYWAVSTDGTQLLLWSNDGTTTPAAVLDPTSAQISIYTKAATDGKVASVASVHDYAHTLNQYTDPELENFNAGDTKAWGTATLTVVAVGSRKLWQTPLSAVTGAGDPIYQQAVASLPSGKFSCSVIVASKPATSAAELYFEVSALDSGGVPLTVANLFPTTDGLANANDAAAAGGSRNTGFYRVAPTGAITVPTRLVVCEGLDISNLVANGAVTLRIYLKTSATHQMTFGLISMRDGNSGDYRVPFVSSKQLLANTTSLTNAASALSHLADRRNVFVDPGFQFTPTKTGSSAVWAGGLTALTDTTSADGEDSITVTNGTVVVKTLASRIGTTGDAFTLGLKVNQRAYGGAGTMQIFVNQLDSSGAQIGGTVLFLKQAAISTSTTPETVWASGTLNAACVNIGLNIQASGNAGNKFEVSLIDLHKGSVQAHRPNINTLGFPHVYVDPANGHDYNRGTSGSPFASLARAAAELKRFNDRIMVGRVNLFGGDYSDPSFLLGDTNVGAQSIVGHVELVALDRQRVRWLCPDRVTLASITKAAGHTNLYQAALASLPDISGGNNFAQLYEHETDFDLISAAAMRPLHRGRFYRSPVGIMRRVVDAATADATPNSYYWDGAIVYFYPPTANPLTNGKSYYFPRMTLSTAGDSTIDEALHYAMPGSGSPRAGSLWVSGIDFYYWKSACALDGLAWAEFDDCRAIATGFTGFEGGGCDGIFRRCEAIGTSQDGFGWYPGSITLPVAANYRTSRWTLEDCYAALNGDDCVSGHVLSDVKVRGGLFEKPADSCIPFALGGTCDIEGARCYKAGQFLTDYQGNVVNQGEGISTRTGTDDRSGTNISAVGCEIEQCVIGVSNENYANNRISARNVLTIGCTTAYKNATGAAADMVLNDCRDLSSTTVKSGSITVNTSVAVA